MDPEALGLTVAALLAKAALEKAGQQAGGAGWEALEQVGQRLRGWFRRRGDTDGEQALALVEKAPDSNSALQSLATVVTAAAREDPAEAQELEGVVGRAQAEGGERMATFVNQVRDEARVGRIIQVSGAYYERGE